MDCTILLLKEKKINFSHVLFNAFKMLSVGTKCSSIMIIKSS